MGATVKEMFSVKKIVVPRKPRECWAEVTSKKVLESAISDSLGIKKKLRLTPVQLYKDEEKKIERTEPVGSFSVEKVKEEYNSGAGTSHDKTATISEYEKYL